MLLPESRQESQENKDAQENLVHLFISAVPVKKS